MDNLSMEYELFKSFCQLKTVTRTAENEQLIKNLQKNGLKLKQNEDKFSIDTGIIALSEKKIRNALNLEINELIHTLDILYQTSSTNKTIAQKSSNPKFSILLTEFQTAGQGRREKKWISPLAENIYLSIQFQVIESKNAHFIPLLTAVSICKSLKKSGIQDCKIKWPNDIYLDGKKLAGILVENRCLTKQGSTFIVGIGLNVNMQINNEIDQLWTSLLSHQKKSFDRNIIISTLLSELLETYNNISRMDLNLFMQEWRLLDYLYGSEINITDENLTYAAIAHGIAADGALLVSHTKDKTLKKIYSADVSVKSSKNN